MRLTRSRFGWALRGYGEASGVGVCVACRGRAEVRQAAEAFQGASYGRTGSASQGTNRMRDTQGAAAVYA
jgi:hypothetical protein